jgi:cob(I)alamin adenosyltransferase
MMARERDEPVRLTRIYTRTGDEGQTSLGDLSRVPKTHPRVVAYGTVDELNSQLGLALAAGLPEAMRAVLERVQNELFDLGADVSSPGSEGLRVTAGQVEVLEADCDRFNAELPPLKSFVLPGGAEAAARLHVARTVCRRAELEALRAGDLSRLVPVYLNRLSDLLFILARAANAAAGQDEPLWKPGSSQQGS